MLDPVTKRFEDASDMRRFEFIFFCGCCGKAIPSTALEYHSGFRPKRFLTADEREVRAIIYADHHGKAYERANNEVLHELNRCERCGDMVCEDCTVYNENREGGEGVFNTIITGPGIIVLQTMPAAGVAGALAPFLLLGEKK